MLFLGMFVKLIFTVIYIYQIFTNYFKKTPYFCIISQKCIVMDIIRTAFQICKFLCGRQSIKWYGIHSDFTFSLPCILHQRSSFLTAEEIDPRADARA